MKKIPSEFPKRPVFSLAHRKCGNLWVRRTKNGKTAMTGYVWYYNRHKKRRVVMTVKIIVNPLKTTEKAPDYCIYDYSGEYEKKRHDGLLAAHWNTVTGRPQEVAEMRSDSQAPGREPGGEH